MAILRPRPRHGRRDFIREVGIIVVGVLIALAGEQLVEWLDWQNKAGEARVALRDEIIDGYLSSGERIVQTPCLNSQLDRLKARVLAPGDTLAPATLIASNMGPRVLVQPSRLWSDTFWQNVRSEQIASHLGDRERIDITTFYNSIAVMRRLNQDEITANGELMALASPLPLDPAVRARFVALIETARARANFMDLVARQQRSVAREIVPDIASRAAAADRAGPMGSFTIGYFRAQRLPLARAP